MFKYVCALLVFYTLAPSTTVAAGSNVYTVEEGDLFEMRFSGQPVLKSPTYNDEMGEASLREDGSWEKMIRDGKIMLLRKGDQLRVIWSGDRPTSCTVVRRGKEIGKWFYPAMFMSDEMKRLNALSEERKRTEKERNAPITGSADPPHGIEPSPAASRRAREQERKDTIKGAEYRTWAGPTGMMIEAQFIGLAGGKVTLLKRGGSKVEIPLADLFEEDQDWVAETVKQQAAIEKVRWRTWTNATGKYKIEARFGGRQNDNVTLIKRDGSKIRVRLEALSDEDRGWIANRSRQAPVGSGR